MAFSDNFFKKIEKKTNVNKDTILSLANKLQQGDMKDEATLREVIQDISRITGREVSAEKEQKIVDTVMANNGVPKDFNQYLNKMDNQTIWSGFLFYGENTYIDQFFTQIELVFVKFLIYYLQSYTIYGIVYL